MVGKNFSTHTTFVIENNIPDRFKESMIENGWTEILYPSYLPSGYELNDVICTKLRCRFEFSNGEKSFALCIKRLVENSGHIKDTENTVVQNMLINDKEAKFILKGDKKDLIILDNETVLWIASATVDKLQIIDIAESLKNFTII